MSGRYNKFCALLVALLAAFATMPLFLPYFFASSDGLFHLYRVMEYHTLFRQGVWYPRWAPDFFYGLGMPLFNFYAPLTYYLAEPFRIFGGGYLGSLRWMVAAAMAASGLGAYAYARTLLSPVSSVLLAVVYMYVPYHLVNLYYRGDLAEYLAAVWFPLILWAAARLVQRKRLVYLCAGAACYAALILTHNLSALLFSGFLAIYALAALARQHGIAPARWRAAIPDALRLAGMALLAWALSAFFWVPAMAEKHLVDFDSLFFHFDFRKYFPTLEEFFATDLIHRYGVPFPGSEVFGFRLGLLQAIFLALGLVVLLWQRRRIAPEQRGEAIASLAVVGISLFLIFPVSIWAWENVPLLPYTQNPWRFLAFIALPSALFAALLVELLPTRLRVGAVALLVPLVIASGVGGLAPILSNVKEADISPRGSMQFELTYGAIGTSAAAEYLPRTVKERPATSPIAARAVLDEPLGPPAGRAAPGMTVTEVEKRALQSTYRVRAERAGDFVPHVVSFPGWVVYLDGHRIEAGIDDPTGLIKVAVPEGEHTVTLRFEETGLRLASDLASAVALLLLLALLAPSAIRALSRARAMFARSAVTAGHLPVSASSAASSPSLPNEPNPGYPFAPLTSGDFSAGREPGVPHPSPLHCDGEGTDAGASRSRNHSHALRAGSVHPVSSSSVPSAPSAISAVKPGPQPPSVPFVISVVKSGPLLWQIALLAVLAASWLLAKSAYDAAYAQPARHQFPLAVDLDHEVIVEGYDLAGVTPTQGLAVRLPSGGSLRLTLYWHLQNGDATTRYRPFVRLTNTFNQTWAFAESPIEYSAAIVKPGETVATTFDLAVPPGMPPGVYELEMQFASSAKPRPLQARQVIVAPLMPGDNGARIGPIILTKSPPVAGGRLDSGKQPPLLAEPVNFDQHLHLLDVSLSAGPVRDAGRPSPPLAKTAAGDAWQLRAGEAVRFDLLWQALEKLGGDLTITARLAGGDRVLWAVRDSQPADGIYPTSFWSPNEVVRDLLHLAIPPETPPGEYELQLEVISRAGPLSVLDQNGAPAGPTLRLGRLAVLPASQVADPKLAQIPRRLNVPLSDGLAVLGYGLGRPELQPGEQLKVDVLWQAPKAPGRDLQMRLEVLDKAGNVWASETRQPAGDVYPTTAWREGEILRGQYNLTLRADTPAGEVDVVLSLRDAASGADLGRLRLDAVRILPRTRSFTAAPQRPLTKVFDGKIRLLGFDLASGPRQIPEQVPELAPGDNLAVTLHWQAMAGMATNYTVFAQVLNAAGRLVAQHDAAPRGGQAPTTGWVVGEVVGDEHTITLPADLPEGSYTVIAGIYDSITGKRLALEGGGDFVLLANVRLIAKAPPGQR